MNGTLVKVQALIALLLNARGLSTALISLKSLCLQASKETEVATEEPLLLFNLLLNLIPF